MNILIMGAPGSGKGTVSNRIRDTYNLNHISTGDIFRDQISRQTPLGKQAQAYTEQGKLVPDEITNAMVAKYLEELPDKKNGYLLDGYPRTLDQAEAFAELVAGSEDEPEIVLAMDVPADVLTKRITGRRTCKNCGEIFNIYYKPPKVENECDNCHCKLSQRADDTEEALKVRLDEYFSNTAPVLGYYEERNKDMVKHINADADFDDVWADIKEVLD